MASDLHNEELRTAVRGQLMRELVQRTLVHDVRGALTAALGWVELMSMDGADAPPGLTRSIEGIRTVTTRYAEVAWPEDACTDAWEQACQALGIELDGGGGPPLSALRLVAALELAAPKRVRIYREPKAVGVVAARLYGLPDHVTSLALSPHTDDIFPRLLSPDRALGCCLLREVGSSIGAELGRREPMTLDLLMPG